MRWVPFLFLLLAGCNREKTEAGGTLTGYDLSKPVATFGLPAVLQEISGITMVDSSVVACVQDENGVIFFYDLDQKKIVRTLFFGYDGDYEAITRAGDKLFVLRSDGVLYEVPDFHASAANTIHHDTRVPASNNEGLVYDAAANRLLIASKGKVEDEEKDERYLFSFNLRTKTLDRDPALAFSIIDITQRAVDIKIHEPYRTTKKGKAVPNWIKVRTSEIAIHPFTGDLYMLAAMDHLLMVFDTAGKIKQLQKLDPVVFNQAEGLAFMHNGDMLISNEGGPNGQPTLLRFRFAGSVSEG